MDNQSSLNRIQELTYAVGRCILTWSDIEIQLSVIFASVANTTDRTAFGVLDAVASFEARLKIIDNTFYNCITDQDLTFLWGKLRKKASQKHRKRSEVAHCYLSYNENTEQVIPYATFLKPIKTLSKKELIERGDSFINLADSLKWLHMEILRRKGHLGQNPVTPTALVERLLEEISRQNDQK